MMAGALDDYGTDAPTVAFTSAAAAAPPATTNPPLFSNGNFVRARQLSALRVVCDCGDSRRARPQKKSGVKVERPSSSPSPPPSISGELHKALEAVKALDSPPTNVLQVVALLHPALVAIVGDPDDVMAMVEAFITRGLHFTWNALNSHRELVRAVSVIRRSPTFARTT